MDAEVKKSTQHVFQFEFFERDTKIIPSSATIAIYDDDNAVKVASTSATIGVDGTISYTMASTIFDDVCKNNRVDLTYTYDSKTINVSYFFDIVNNPIISIISDRDLFSYYPRLRKKYMEFDSITTSSGTTTTLVDTRLNEAADYWNGGYVEIYQGSRIHIAKITDYTTDTITFSPAYTEQINEDTIYKMRASYQGYIDSAFDILRRDVRNNKEIMARYVTSEAFKLAHIFKTIELIALSSRERPEDVWDMAAADFGAKYSEQIRSYAGAYDVDDDQEITQSETRLRQTDIQR